MLADFYIPRLSNDMKIAGQKNHLVGQILYRSLVPIKKTASLYFTFFATEPFLPAWKLVKYHLITAIILSRSVGNCGIAEKKSAWAKKSEYISSSDRLSSINVGSTTEQKSLTFWAHITTRNSSNFCIINYSVRKEKN